MPRKTNEVEVTPYVLWAKGPEIAAPPPHDAPLNLPQDGDVESLVAMDVSVMAVANSPALGTFTLVTRDGHFNFLIGEDMANDIVRELRTFLRGDSPLLFND